MVSGDRFDKENKFEAYQNTEEIQKKHHKTILWCFFCIYLRAQSANN
jgi:hypothetical protein